MKYSDLVQFEPIQSVKVLRDAEDADKAAEDVRTFVVSDRMLEQLEGVIVPHLRFDQPGDNKGLLTVANYGTGKTHLMSVISGVAEHVGLLAAMTNDDAADAMKPLAGQFKVLRAEIGMTTMSLRDIVCRELENGLSKLGIDFTFPGASEVTNTKDSLTDMMVAFEGKFSDKGLLFVLDELLDYLRGRKDAELVHDLSFLREVGEICKNTRFRFIGGIQEAIFDNPRFAGFADPVRRVKDRFEQIRISREDVAFVVTERLLKKSVDQRDKIREHLNQFAPLYEGMAERLEEFVALFPVHPAYLRTFQQITAVEKREVLKTLSGEIKAIVGTDLPTDQPGLICYDSYRERLSEDPSVRAIPDVRKVLEKNEVLRNKIAQALPNKQYLPTAQRIIDALAVHRLTTDDIKVPIGATVKELRDDLCLLPTNLPEMDSFFLEATIDSIIEDIMRAVSGQFITQNPDNGQIYLDVEKDVDYDQQIEERASHLDEERLDNAYFKALEEVLERRDTPYVSGYRIWQYELVWASHKVGRTGYLFMGAPNERSTAQPPRDFYVYFIQPYDPPLFQDEKKADEVFFRLEKPDDDFTSALRRYAGAIALASETTAGHRHVYDDKAAGSLRTMVTWLKKNMGEAITVTHLGRTQPLSSWLSSVTGPRGTVKDQIDSIASEVLEPHFDDRYPGYPKFEVVVTKDNLQETVRQALNHIAINRKTDLSHRVLRSLALLDKQEELSTDGDYAALLAQKLAGAGGVAINRDELLFERDKAVFGLEPWFLEPVWVAVIAAALTQLGRAELGFQGQQIDALALDRLTRMSVEELDTFTHIAPPKELPVLQLRDTMKLLDLPPGLIGDQGIEEHALPQVLARVQETMKRVVGVRGQLSDAPLLWGELLFDSAQERDARLAPLQKILEDLKARNTLGKMNRLDVGSDAIEKARAGTHELARAEAISEAAVHLQDAVSYLREATEVFGIDHPLSEDTSAYREEVLTLFRADGGPTPAEVTKVRSAGEDIRRRFADEAARAHQRDRLDGEGDKRKKSIITGEDFLVLKQLALVGILPHGAFGTKETAMLSIGTCLSFDERDMAGSVVCPHCKYGPVAKPGPTAVAVVKGLEDELASLRNDWTAALLDSLSTTEMKEQIELLGPDESVAVQEFIEARTLPSPVTNDFVKALNSVFNRFERRNVTPNDLWESLFSERFPITVDELRKRFSDYLLGVVGIADEDKVRVIPVEDQEEGG